MRGSFSSDISSLLLSSDVLSHRTPSPATLTTTHPATHHHPHLWHTWQVGGNPLLILLLWHVIGGVCVALSAGVGGWGCCRKARDTWGRGGGVQLYGGLPLPWQAARRKELHSRANKKKNANDTLARSAPAADRRSPHRICIWISIFSDLCEMNHCTCWGMPAGWRYKHQRFSHAHFTGTNSREHI